MLFLSSDGGGKVERYLTVAYRFTHSKLSQNQLTSQLGLTGSSLVSPVSMIQRSSQHSKTTPVAGADAHLPNYRLPVIRCSLCFGNSEKSHHFLYLKHLCLLLNFDPGALQKAINSTILMIREKFNVSSLLKF